MSDDGASPPAKRARADDGDGVPAAAATAALDRLASKLPTRPAKAALLLARLLRESGASALDPDAVAGCLLALAGGTAAPLGAGADAATAKEVGRLFSGVKDAGIAVGAAVGVLGEAAAHRSRFSTDDSFELAAAVRAWKADVAGLPTGADRLTDVECEAASGRLAAAAAAAPRGARAALDAAGAFGARQTVALRALGLIDAIAWLSGRAGRPGAPWAAPSADAALAAATAAAASLPPSLASRVATLARDATAAKRARGGGRPAAGGGATTFEKDAARWAGGSVSAKGSVGALGDGKGLQLLGGG